MIQNAEYGSFILDCGRAFHPARYAEYRLFMILRVYVDVSGKEDQHRVVTAAGYIASESEVEEFEHRWGATCDFATVTGFHATEFFACKGKRFKHLIRGSDHHKQSAALFALTAYSSFQKGFAYSIDVDHYYPKLGRVLSRVQTPHDRMPPPVLAVARVGLMAFRSGIVQGGHEAVMFIEQGDGVGEIIDWLWFLKTVGEPWTAPFRNFAPLPKSERALQAADYLAHEAWLETAQRLENPARQWADIERETFKLITTGPTMRSPIDGGVPKVTLDYATESHFKAMAPRFAVFIKANPHYQRRPWYHRWRRRSRLWRNALWRETRRYIVGKGKRIWFRYFSRGKRRRKPTQ